MISRMLPASASTLELTWTGVAFAGSGFAIGLLAHIWLSYLAVRAWIRQGRALRGGPRHRFVVGFLFGVSLLVLVWLGFVALGVNAMLNPPPLTPERVEASERGGWILVILESALLLFQVVLLAAWVSVGRPRVPPTAGPNAPAVLLFRAIDLGRTMGHTIANEAQGPMGVLDEIADDATVSPALRIRARNATHTLQGMIERVHEMHEAVKALETIA